MNDEIVTAVGDPFPRLQGENWLTAAVVAALLTVSTVVGRGDHDDPDHRNSFRLDSMNPANSSGALFANVPSSYFRVRSVVRPEHPVPGVKV